jgi:hypothetical protein
MVMKMHSPVDAGKGFLKITLRTLAVGLALSLCLIASREMAGQTDSKTLAIDTVKKLSGEIDQYVKSHVEPNLKLIARRNPIDRSLSEGSWEWKRVEYWYQADVYFKGYWSFLKATVWTRNSKVACVATGEWSDSGDWTINTNYHFDGRGRLLQISTDFLTRTDKIEILDFQYFDGSGQLLEHKVEYYALGFAGHQKLSEKPENMQIPMHDIPIYLKASDLPFYGLLNLDLPSPKK